MPGDRLIKAAVLTGLVTYAFLVGAGHATFSGGDQNAANRFTAGYWVPRHVQLVGTTSCGATSDIVTVSAPVAFGDTIIVRFVMRDASNSAATATDSKGNEYLLDAQASANKHDYAIFSAAVTNPLVAGDTITVTHQRSAKATFMRVDEFAGISTTGRVVSSATSTGSGASMSVAAPVPLGTTLTVAGVGVQGAVTLTAPGGWTALDSGTTVCNRDLTTVGGYRVISTAGFATFGTSWSGSQIYAGVIVGYRGG